MVTLHDPLRAHYLKFFIPLFLVKYCLPVRAERSYSRMIVKWSVAAVALPEQDGDALRALAVSAGWMHEMLMRPPPQVRKDDRFSLFRHFLPPIQPHGIVAVVNSDAFHGVQLIEKTAFVDSPQRCPFR